MPTTPARDSVGIASKGRGSVGRGDSVGDAEEASPAVSAERAWAFLEDPVSGATEGVDTSAEAVLIGLAATLLLHQ